MFQIITEMHPKHSVEVHTKTSVEVRLALGFLGCETAQKPQLSQSPLPGKGGNRGDGNDLILLVGEPYKTVW